MCGGDLQRTRLIEDATTYLRAEVNRYKDWQRVDEAHENEELRKQVAHQQEEAEKWRQLYSVSRHQASRALDMHNSAKVQIEVLENKLNGRQ